MQCVKNMICRKTEMSLKLPEEQEILSREILWGFRQIKFVPLRWLEVWVFFFSRVVEQINPRCLSMAAVFLPYVWREFQRIHQKNVYAGCVYYTGFNRRETFKRICICISLWGTTELKERTSERSFVSSLTIFNTFGPISFKHFPSGLTRCLRF